MSDSTKKSTTQRRSALKKILVSTGAAGVVASAPEKWSKPMVDAITLPAHAMTSLPLSYTQMNVALAPEKGLEEILIPTAHAGFGLNNGSICVNFNADMTTYSVLIVWGNTNPPGADQTSSVNGIVNTILPLEGYDCGDQTSLYLLVRSGPDQNGVPYTLYDQNPNTATSAVSSFDGTLLPGECSTTASCPS